MASVELDNLHKRYDDVHVVRGVSLGIASGEFLVLVGPSGCGKSTTLRMIAGLEDISQGELRIGGTRMNDTPPKDRDIGMVFQSYALYPHMSVEQNIAFGLRLRGADAGLIRERVDETAATLGLTELLNRRPGQLSGGQRQRVAMGRAIARQPKVFLFDEPLSNLDAALRVQMRTELAALHRRLGTTMVYVTHDQVEAMTLATRIAVLHQGVLQQVGEPLELFSKPANKFVAGFLGSPSMNFLDGEIGGDGSGPTFVSPLGFELPLGDVDLGGYGPGTPITLGIRPHDVQLDGRTLTGRIVMIERMGWEAFLHLDVDGTRLVVRAEGRDARDAAANDTVSVEIPIATSTIFGPDDVALPRRTYVEGDEWSEAFR